MNKINIIHSKTVKLCIALSLCASITGCSETFLDPDPLSFYEPSTTYTTVEGLNASLASCDYHIKTIWAGRSDGYADAAPICTEYMFSDLAVNGTTDKSYSTQDIVQQLDYTSAVDNNDRNRILWFWTGAYEGIKYANTITSYIDQVEGLDENVKNDMLGRAYFHRSFWYYNLCFQFKDVPLMTRLVEVPKFDYRSTKREVILDMIISDLEFAVKWVADKPELIGMINKGACRQLLIKCYLAKGEFDKAIEQANILIEQSGYNLMKDNFGTFVNPNSTIWNITENVIWDLHRPENKCISANKEAILSMPNRDEEATSRLTLRIMRNTVPMWVQGGALGIKAPDMTPDAIVHGLNTDMDYRKALGRGIARIRPTWHATHTMWLNDKTDLRHDTKSGNWITMESLVYNGLKEDHPYYRKHLQKFNDKGELLCGDTIRGWFDWPHYKVWVADPRNETNPKKYDGGAADLYIYRLAETYLLRAEAKLWKGDKAGAAADVNEVRQRAHCSKLFNENEMNMGVIMDERARELYYEELRHVELSRVSYIFAITGKTDEFGKTYTVDGLSDDSYWYQRINKYNNFYNKGVVTRSKVEYTIAPMHLYWPIPKSAIDDNRKGILNQNKGYTGYENNIEPFGTLEEALADELQQTK